MNGEKSSVCLCVWMRRLPRWVSLVRWASGVINLSLSVALAVYYVDVISFSLHSPLSRLSLDLLSYVAYYRPGGCRFISP